MAALRPSRKRHALGQHFMKDPALASELIGALCLSEGDLVVEIGAGKGYFTEKLVELPITLVACEVDQSFFKLLERRFGDRVELIFGDARAIDFRELTTRYAWKCRVTGNLPYSVSSQIMAHIFSSVDCISNASFTVQRELANRMVASCGSSDWCRLSCLVQYHASCRITRQFPPSSFEPPPKVWSCVVALDMMKGVSRTMPAKDPGGLFELIKAGFAHRRKTLVNSLSFEAAEPKEQYLSRVHTVMRQLKLDPVVRAEQLSLEKFIAFSDVLTME